MNMLSDSETDFCDVGEEEMKAWFQAHHKSVLQEPRTKSLPPTQAMQLFRFESYFPRAIGDKRGIWESFSIFLMVCYLEEWVTDLVHG